MEALPAAAVATLEKMMADWGAPDREELSDGVTFFTGQQRSAAVILLPSTTKEARAVALLKAVEEESVLRGYTAHRAAVIIPDARRNLPKLRKDASVGVFEEREIMFNVQAHADVPRLRVLTGEEAEGVRQAFPGKLPEMLAADPQGRYHCARPGDIVQLTRHTENGEETYYRQVR